MCQPACPCHMCQPAWSCVIHVWWRLKKRRLHHTSHRRLEKRRLHHTSHRRLEKRRLHHTSHRRLEKRRLHHTSHRRLEKRFLHQTFSRFPARVGICIQGPTITTPRHLNTHDHHTSRSARVHSLTFPPIHNFRHMHQIRILFVCCVKFVYGDAANSS